MSLGKHWVNVETWLWFKRAGLEGFSFHPFLAWNDAKKRAY